MAENLKVSIQLNLEIPVEYGPDGHRKSPTALVAPYIDRMFWDMRMQGLTKADYELEDLEYYEKLESMHFGKNETAKAQIRKEADAVNKSDMDKILHEMWKEGQDQFCKEKYGCSWDEYRNLPDDRKEALRAEYGTDLAMHKSLDMEHPYAS